MLLRASGQRENQDFDLTAVNTADTDPGVPHAEHLRALTEATINGDWQALPEIRNKAIAAMGAQQAIDALIVASGFNGITRVADSTGIPLDPNTEATTQEMREETGIQRFHYAEKSDRFDHA